MQRFFTSRSRTAAAAAPCSCAKLAKKQEAKRKPS